MRCFHKMRASRGLTLGVPVVLFGLAGCDVSQVGTPSLEGVTLPGQSAGTEAPPADRASQETCYEDRFTQPDEEPGANKLDLLFVVDTSGSLADEKKRVVDGIDAFIQQLPSQVDLQIGVLLGHGSRSAWSGKLFRAKTEPVVLRSSSMTLDALRRDLRLKMNSTPSDNASDGGEESFYSLQSALTGAKLAEIRGNQGFLRTDAAMAVVFVADENDVCATYPRGVLRAGDSNKLELPAFFRDCVGARGAVAPGAAPATESFVDIGLAKSVKLDAATELKVSHETVFAKLKEVAGDRPMVISAIVYTDPKFKRPYPMEEEYGWGYMDLIRVANGLAVDISTVDYRPGLARIGALCRKKMELRRDFPLTYSNVDVSSILAYVDSRKTEHTYTAESRTVHLTDAGGARSQVLLSYCENSTGTGSGGSGTGSGSGGSNPPPSCTTAAECEGLGI